MNNNHESQNVITVKGNYQRQGNSFMIRAQGEGGTQEGLWKGLCLSTSGRKLVLIAQSCLTLCNPIFVACQVHPSMEFSRQEHWSGLPFPSPGKEAKKVRKLQLAIDRVCVHAGLTASRVFCYLSLSQ